MYYVTTTSSTVVINVTFSCAVTSSRGADAVLSYSSIKDINYSIYRSVEFYIVTNGAQCGFLEAGVRLEQMSPDDPNHHARDQLSIPIKSAYQACTSIITMSHAV